MKPTCAICGAESCKCGGPAKLKYAPVGENIKMVTSIQKRNGAGASAFISDRRLYLDENGNAVEANDPARSTLLVGKGGAMPMARARELGIVGIGDAAPSDETEAKAITAPPQNKAMLPAKNK